MPKKLLSCLFFMILAACAVSPDKPMALRKVSFSSLPGWKQDSLDEAFPALKRSCERPQKAWESFCAGLNRLDGQSSKEIRRYLEKELVAYQVYSYGKKEGTFTGYYEASLKGSFQKSEDCSVPIYGIPSDFVMLNTQEVCQPGGDKGILYGRLKDGKFTTPYLTRSQINETEMAAPVLLWVDSSVDAFILHIQGSGRVETPEGVVHLGYAANNGHPFLGIGSIMKAEGLLESGKSSMPYIRKWLKENPKKAEQLMAQNPRYIFFRILPQSDGPLGSAGVSLTPGRSLAVDTTYIPLNTPIFLNTKTPDGDKIQKLVVAQDTGNAIKGAIRGDFFWGFGENAFQMAGRMKSDGEYFLLWPKGEPLPTEGQK